MAHRGPVAPEGMSRATLAADGNGRAGASAEPRSGTRGAVTTLLNDTTVLARLLA